MRLFADLPAMVDQMPGWAQIVVGILLVVFSLASIYGRVNVDFGGKIFSRIPKEKLKSDIGHIIRYTIIPIIATGLYFWAWLT